MRPLNPRIQHQSLKGAREAVKVLVSAGAPLSGRSSGPAPGTPAWVDAVTEIRRLPGDSLYPPPWYLEAIGAWILAWAHEWPTGFADAFGADAAVVTAWARAHILDHGRYIKLRRIAIANLATIL